MLLIQNGGSHYSMSFVIIFNVEVLIKTFISISIKNIYTLFRWGHVPHHSWINWQSYLFSQTLSCLWPNFSLGFVNNKARYAVTLYQGLGLLNNKINSLINKHRLIHQLRWSDNLLKLEYSFEEFMGKLKQFLNALMYLE